MDQPAEYADARRRNGGICRISNVSQFDFYDRKDIVLAAADAVAEFFRQ